MTIEQWLSNVYYDEHGVQIWNREGDDGRIQCIADLRGWGRLQNEYGTFEDAANFQDEVGAFIVEAIREKIEQLKNK